ncbi:MAG: HD domain-containing protein [Peptostreptococcaceae bacterium]
MKPLALLEILKVAEKLKCNTRHSWTSSGRQESVAEHSWRIALMALLMRDEFPEVNMDKVIHMCLIHDLGEAITGDIPSFEKKEEDDKKEDEALIQWVSTFPEPYCSEFIELLEEMNSLETEEAKLYKALDNIEVVIQHNEADISTWIPLEYELQLTYGSERVGFSKYITELREEIKRISINKIEESKK